MSSALRTAMRDVAIVVSIVILLGVVFLAAKEYGPFAPSIEAALVDELPR